jgi:hypothetical protein
VAVVESGAGRRGSLFHDLEVPDYRASGLTLSGLVVTSLRESRVPVAAAKEERQAVALPPSTRRSFSREDELLVLAEIYPNPRSGAAGAASLEVTTVLKSADGTIVFQSSEKRGVDEMAVSGNGVSHQLKIPLSGISQGEYVLQVKARDAQGGGEAERQVPIHVL